MADTAAQSERVDPRARFVDFDGLDWDEFPAACRVDGRPLGETPSSIARQSSLRATRTPTFVYCRSTSEEIDQDRFPPIGQWSDTEYDRAVRLTREARAARDGALAERAFQAESAELGSIPISERLALVDFQLLSLDQFPPITDWHEEHWWQAMMATYSDWMHRRIDAGEGRDGQPRSGIRWHVGSR